MGESHPTLDSFRSGPRRFSVRTTEFVLSSSCDSQGDPVTVFSQM